MSTRTLVKVYGNISSASPELMHALEPVARQALPTPDDPVLEQDGDMLRIHFEGICFPLEEFLEVVLLHLSKKSLGKVDYIDLDAWKLHRHIIEGKSIRASSVSLNNVLDYSGH